MMKMSANQDAEASANLLNINIKKLNLRKVTAAAILACVIVSKNGRGRDRHLV